MAMITLDIPEERMKLLVERAQELRITPEDLIYLGVAELLMQPTSDVQQAIAYILRKHADLYQRLA